MRQGEDKRKVPYGNQAREHGCSDGQAEEALADEWLDVILSPALKLALGDAEPTTAVWTKIQETLGARRQDASTGEGE